MIIRRLGYSSLLPAIRFLSVFLLTIFLTKEISVEDYGLWSLFISISGLAVTIGSLNLMYSSQILLNDYEDNDKPSIITSLFVLKFCCHPNIIFSNQFIYFVYRNICL